MSNLNQISIFIVGAKGIPVDLKIPNFPSAHAFSFSYIFSDFVHVYKNGTQVRESSAGSLETSPFKSQQQIALLVREIRYHLNTCPLMFNSAFLMVLGLFSLADSMVEYNMLAFEKTERTLDSNVGILQMSGYGLRFDTRIFPLVVFATTQNIIFTGMMNSFEAVALKSSKLRSVTLAISRLRRFLHNNPDWLNEANKRSLEHPLIVTIETPEEYDKQALNMKGLNYVNIAESDQVDAFDDSSFCIFYQIEQYSLNVKFLGKPLESRANESCSCLLFWIVSFHVLNPVSCVNAAQLSEQCKFSEMAQRCSIETIESINYRTIYETILDLEFFKYLADVWLVPVTSLLGILANFLVIRTFRNIKRSPEYRRNKLTDKGKFMWEYTYYNSWFMLFHGLIFLFGPLTTCIEVNGIYCSRFIMTNFFRPYYLFVEKFFGNTFLLAANMSSTLFVLYRFGLNTDKLVRFRQVKPKTLITCLFILTLLISVITLFVNEKFGIDTISEHQKGYLMQNESPILDSNLPLKVAFLLNIFMGTILFTFLNMIIDLRLWFQLRSRSRQRIKEEAEKRITKMVILNGVFSFLFRLPEMLSASILLVFTLSPNFFPICILRVSRYHSVCPMLFSISHFLLTVSYLENLLLLYFFNPNFHKYFRYRLSLQNKY
nr:G protein-coupled receptor [Proales similis]